MQVLAEDFRRRATRGRAADERRRRGGTDEEDAGTDSKVERRKGQADQVRDGSAAEPSDGSRKGSARANKQRCRRGPDREGHPSIRLHQRAETAGVRPPGRAEQQLSCYHQPGRVAEGA